jgi:hypothetical protein
MTDMPKDLPLPMWRSHLELPVDPGGYAFNPTVFRGPAGLMCVWRHVDAGRVRSLRRCRLNDDFTPSGGFACWTDEARALGGEIRWYAEPRAVALNGRHFINFNTGYTENPNNIYIVEVDAEARPITPALRLVKRDGRQDIEKNWGFFACDGELFALYALVPFTVLRLTLAGGEMHAETAAVHDWPQATLEARFGALHGGASPVRVGAEFLVVVQSCVEGPRGLRYAGSLMSFEARPPFRPLAIAPAPLFRLTRDEEELRPELMLNRRVDGCLYPTGAMDMGDGAFALAYGINDFRCGIRGYRLADLLNCLRPTDTCLT